MLSVALDMTLNNVLPRTPSKLFGFVEISTPKSICLCSQHLFHSSNRL